tara:strand:+ start:755 stop:934 length:180 start_codon:yes stop_codon:yes gene_type:complete
MNKLLEKAKEIFRRLREERRKSLLWDGFIESLNEEESQEELQAEWEYCKKYGKYGEVNE